MSAVARNVLHHPMIQARGIHHIGIAVRSLDAQRSFYEEVLGARFEGIEVVPSQSVRVAFYALGSSVAPIRLELLEPSSPDSPIARFLESRGEGLHHIAYDVDNLETRLAQLAAADFRLVDTTPRPGAHGASIAFLHPSSTHGVLTELRQAVPSITQPSGANA